MTRTRVGIALGLLCFLSLVGSCKSEDDDVSRYKDNRGRVCSVPLGIYNPKADCDEVARPVAGCAVGVPCFTLNPLLDSGQMRNCDTCCVDDSPKLPDFRDCAQVTCRSDADCVYSNARCVDSFCFFLPQAGAGGGGAGGASGAGAGGAPIVSGGAAGTPSAAGAGAVSAGASAGGSFGGSMPVAGSPAAGAPGFPGSGGASGAFSSGGGGRGGSAGAGTSGSFGFGAGRSGF